MSFLTPTSQPTEGAPEKTPIDELFDRNPLEFTEDNILGITEELIRLCRANIEQFNSEQTRAAKTGGRVSGARIKKAQLTAQQQALVTELGTNLDPFA